MTKLLYKLIFMLSVAVMLPTVAAYALPADHYAANSKLASGMWAKVKIRSAGMQVISDAQLRNLGFTNPGNVHVYGLGGRELDYGLNADTPDDLPLIPSVRTSKGIVFFAIDNVTWESNRQEYRPYSHRLSQYSDDTYYFISDVEVPADEMPMSVTSNRTPGNGATTFTERALHEAELEPADEIGSQIWGEDFRSKKFNTFSFTLPDMADEETTAFVRFASKVSNGASASIAISANGEQLVASDSDKMAGCSSGHFGTIAETWKRFDVADGKLDLGIDFSYSGVLYKARLDYIEIFYNRELKLKNGELHFYIDFSRTSADGVSVAGCGERTVIWDVTDPVRPAKVEYVLEGDVAHFSAPRSAGYREFVAFNPENISRTVTPAGMVVNQDIHGLETPDMLIISPQAYIDGAKSIADVHRNHDGMVVHVLTPEQIYNEFSGGKPDCGAFRRLMKMWHDRGEENGHKLGYCLIMGKALNDNKMVGAVAKSAGFKPMPMWQSYEGMTETTSYSTDDWLGMLDDVNHSDFSMRTGKMRVAVGRLPVTSAQESRDMAAKINKYVTEPDLGAWRNKVMLIADDSDNGDHFYQTDNVYNGMRSTPDGRHRLYDRVILDSYELTNTGTGNRYPEATNRMMSNYNNGVLLTNYIGHASPGTWGHEHLWDWVDIKSMTNKRLTFIMAYTCGFAYWDTMEPCGAEALILNPDAGIIGMIAATRTVYISNNGNLSKSMASHVFEPAADGGTLRWGDVFVRGMNGVTDENRLRYAFIGDPAIRIPGGSGHVTFTSIDGTDIASDPSAMPEINALSTVKVCGEIAGADGNLNTDFNGTVSLNLYDSERVITTHGNGETGVVVSYNDHDKMLSTTIAEVKGGRWEANLRVPPEIQGNYTPALISAYAWSESGLETNGSTRQLYLYGFNDNLTDNAGPKFEAFYVNSPTLPSDAVINRNMIVYAQLRDESGINVSESGIGHSLTLCIDGKDYRTDLKQYLKQDATDYDLNMLAYPLNDVEPGRHTLTLTAWDNANNVSESSIDINVGAAVEPSIFDISAVPTTSGIDFRISLDRPDTSLSCRIGVYDLMGKKLWGSDNTRSTDRDSMIIDTWDLRDYGGARVQRGIYIYRVEVTAADGMHSSKSKKIAISAE